MPIEQLGTIRELAPRLLAILRDLRPTFHLASAAEIDAGFVAAHRVRGVAWDVDGTLMGYHRREIDDSVRTAVSALTDSTTIRHAILSNCDERRFQELGAIFPTIPILRAYRTDDGIVYRSLLNGTDTHSPDEVREFLRRGRQLRKPSGELVGYAASVLGVDVQDLLMVGDQYMTDVASAQLAGARSVKVPTMRPHTFPPAIRFTQQIEKLVYLLRHGRWHG